MSDNNSGFVDLVQVIDDTLVCTIFDSTDVLARCFALLTVGYQGKVVFDMMLRLGLSSNRFLTVEHLSASNGLCHDNIKVLPVSEKIVFQQNRMFNLTPNLLETSVLSTDEVDSFRAEMTQNY